MPPRRDTRSRRRQDAPETSGGETTGGEGTTAGEGSSGAGSSTKRGVRGPASAKKSWKRPIGDFHDVRVSHGNEFIQDGGRELKCFLSSFANSELRMPHVIQQGDKWIHVDWDSDLLLPYKESALQEILGRFKFYWVSSVEGEKEEVAPVLVQRLLFRNICNSWRDHKQKMHVKFLAAESPEAIAAAKPETWSNEYWAALCDHFQSTEYAERSARGRHARQSVASVHRGGGRSSSSRAYANYEESGDVATRVELFRQYYVRDDDSPASQEARERYQQMLEHIRQAEELLGSPLPRDELHRVSDEAVDRYYGQDAPGRVLLAGQHISPTEFRRPRQPSRRPPPLRRRAAPDLGAGSSAGGSGSDAGAAHEDYSPSQQVGSSDPASSVPDYSMLSFDTRMQIAQEYVAKGMQPPKELFF